MPRFCAFQNHSLRHRITSEPPRQTIGGPLLRTTNGKSVGVMERIIRQDNANLRLERDSTATPVRPCDRFDQDLLKVLIDWAAVCADGHVDRAGTDAVSAFDAEGG